VGDSTDGHGIDKKNSKRLRRGNFQGRAVDGKEKKKKRRAHIARPKIKNDCLRKKSQHERVGGGKKAPDREHMFFEREYATRGE